MTPATVFLDKARAELGQFLGPALPEHLALRAVELAQEHGAKYKDRLVGALIRSARQNATPSTPKDQSNEQH